MLQHNTVKQATEQPTFISSLLLVVLESVSVRVSQTRQLQCVYM